MIIEYGHIYYNDIINNTINKEDIIKSITLLKEIKNNSYTSVVLIDDKEFNLTVEEKDRVKNYINRLYDELGEKPHKIYFEKEFSKISNLIYMNLSTKNFKYETFKRDNKEVEFLVMDNKKIALKSIRNNQKFYTCSFLASLWTLYQHLNFSNKRLVCILNKKYESVEKNVDLILKTANYNITKDKIYY